MTSCLRYWWEFKRSVLIENIEYICNNSLGTQYCGQGWAFFRRVIIEDKGEWTTGISFIALLCNDLPTNCRKHEHMPLIWIKDALRKQRLWSVRVTLAGICHNRSSKSTVAYSRKPEWYIHRVVVFVIIKHRWKSSQQTREWTRPSQCWEM